MIRIAVFDDNTSYLEGISILLATSPSYYLCGSFQHANQVEKDFRESRPDVVIMDIQMPGVSGIEAVKKIKALDPKVPVIMLTMLEDDDNILSAIAAGASGYLVKGTPPEAMLASLQEVYEGGSPMSSGIARRVIQLFNSYINYLPEDYKLTPREKDILKSLVDGLSYKMIADRLQISYHTVNAHIRKVYEKLRVNSSHEAVAKAIKQKVV